MSKNYVNIQGWMYELGIEDLRELVALAVVFGFSQDDESSFAGGLKHIMKMCVCSKSTSLRVLSSLEEKGFIKKEQFEVNNVTFCRYKTNMDYINMLLEGGGVKMTPVVSNGDGGGVKMTPKNKIKNNISPTIISSSKEESINSCPLIGDAVVEEVVPTKVKKFVKPTANEVRAYCFERGNDIDAEAFIDFYDSKDWMIGKNRMKDWKAAVRTWEKRHKDDKQKANNYGRRNQGCTIEEAIRAAELGIAMADYELERERAERMAQ